MSNISNDYLGATAPLNYLVNSVKQELHELLSVVLQCSLELRRASRNNALHTRHINIVLSLSLSESDPISKLNASNFICETNNVCDVNIERFDVMTY